MGYDDANGGVPIAMQLMADNWEETTLLRLALAAEQEFAKDRRSPEGYYSPAN